MSKRRISYTIPAATDQVPHLKFPPAGASRFGQTGPWLIPHSHRDNGVRQLPTPRHPRHRLGVSSLALDTSTQLASGSYSPEGILHSGGRDGMIVSWDLHLKMRSKAKNGTRIGKDQSRYRWELMTGWADDVLDEEGDDDEFGDGDVLGEVTSKRKGLREDEGDELPYEHRWTMDWSGEGKVTPSTFRQCAQMHTEWINDLALCNCNQTVVSASSDGTLKAWNPHSQYAPEISVFGQHSDYVRCLAVCREQNWVASGSFDRTIKLWDLSRSASPTPTVNTPPPTPLVTLSTAEKDNTKSSVYAIAADPCGHVIASGSPERIVRIWDPRSGKTTGKLVGHTDNIRAILISDDARYLLTASTDASVKLWSLSSPQRCLHTFTHHTDSVWALYSTHPSLEIFYSGDKSGLVCRVDVSGVEDNTRIAVGAGSTSVSTIDGSGAGFDMVTSSMDVGHGECILVASAGEGIDRMVVLDDKLLWTASGTSSEVKRWRLPPTANSRLRGRAKTGDDDDVGTSRSRSASRDEEGVLNESPISLHAPLPPAPQRSSRSYSSHPHSRHTQSHSQSRSPHPLPSVPRSNTARSQSGKVPLESLIRLQFANDAFALLPSSHSQIGSIGREADVATLYSVGGGRAQSPHRMSVGSIRAQSPQLVRQISEPVLEVNRELASEAVPFCSDGPDSVIPGDNGLVRCIILNDRIHVLTVDTAGEVGVWDIVRGICLGVFPRSSYTSQALNEHWSPREALETVRERIEGEAVVLPWATADTKGGVLTVHLNEDRCFDAEVYADEVGFRGEKGVGDETKLNIGKWALKNLFLGFIREEQRMRRKGSDRDRDSISTSHSHSHHRHRHHHDRDRDQHHHGSSTTSQSSSPSSMSSPSRRSSIHPVTNSPTMIPALPPPSPALQQQSHAASPLATPLIPLAALASITQTPGNDATPLPLRKPTLRRLRSGSVMSGGVGESSESGDNTTAAGGAASPTPLPTNREPSDYFSITRRPSEASTGADESGAREKEKDAVVPSTPATPSGLMGRLKSFGKTRKVTLGAEPTTPALPAVPTGGGGEQSQAQGQGQGQAQETSTASNSAENVTATAIQAILSSPLSPPPSVEAPVHSLPSNITLVISEDFKTLYRGTVNNTGHDVHLLEEAMPLWLAEYLLLNKIPGNGLQPIKVSFILMPWPSKDGEGEQLPELLNITQSKLTASRWLRVRKLVNHVQDKLEKIASSSNVAISSSPRVSIDSQNQGGQHASRPRAEDVYEILCNDVLLPLDMTLAAVRQYVWRQASELTMYYRLKAQ
ncbi:wd repeat containing protein 48 [Moniliophthora roreri MCA 2997]|uniref:Wd repeat containing protein 48 n=1 Tax=Moniliophthora roreri (strain MCA 2997) TaxID=1381753 RepID=V2WZ51_MONRO|nr:wd repeat containing protein 48 [Moniliophthora roreri MCA 2997]